MLLSELIDIIMIETGLFVLGDISKLGLTNTQFWTVTKRALAIYDRYKPISRRSIIICDNNQFIFPDDQAPEFISTCYPTGYGYVNPFTIITTNVDYSGDKPQVVYRYTKPTLITSLGGEFEILGVYKRKVNITYCDAQQTVVNDVEIDDLSDADNFIIDLLTGMILQLVGKSRRGVQLANADVVFDSATMVEEGKTKYDEALDAIQDTQKWYLAIGG